MINGAEVSGENFIEHLMTVISETFSSREDSQPTDPELEELNETIKAQAPAKKESGFDLSFSGSEHPTCTSSVDFIELLLRFILIAVSRTYASGDAFFVIEDLFGGEGLCLCGGSGPNTKRKAEKKTRVRVSSDHVLVELYQQYHLYLAESIGSDEKLIAPLVSFEAKVFTLITFRSTATEITGDGDLFLLLSASPEKICHRLLTITPFLP
jgi:hypothetical protein